MKRYVTNAMRRSGTYRMKSYNCNENIRDTIKRHIINAMRRSRTHGMTRSGIHEMTRYKCNEENQRMKSYDRNEKTRNT